MANATQRLAAVSVDLDEIDCYAAIHGVAEGASGLSAVYERAIGRFAEFFADEGIAATFFVIGRDLASPVNRARIAGLHGAGHEIANHTMTHRYDLTRLDAASMAREIREGADAIENATGRRPVGFRAPGYTITDDVFAALTSQDYLYDSSVFPCPAYYSAKAAALGAIALRGRKSHSVLDTPAVLQAPADPYRIGTPYWSRGQGLLELPVGVARDVFLRAPFIGTSVALAGETGARWLAKSISGRPLVSFELHGIDLVDADEDGLQWLRPHQPDLKKTREQKQSALRSAIHTLRNEGYQFVTCETAARAFAF